MKPIQPKGNAPISKDVMDVVKKKLAPPKGPPPAGMTNFHAPKMYTPGDERFQSYDVEDSLDDGDRDRRNGVRTDFNNSFDDQDDRSNNDKHNRDKTDHSMAADSKTVPSSNDDKNELSAKPTEKLTPTKGDGKQVLFNFQPILRATYRELRHFVTSPAPPGMTVRCYIERNRSGSKMFAPFFSICADLEDGTGRELMVCRKVMQSRSPHYVFSLKAEDLWRKREQRSRLYLGKLRGVSANEYVLYDNGICAAPDSREIEEDDDDDIDEAEAGKQIKTGAAESKPSGSEEVSLYRKELAVIVFNTKARPAKEGVRGCEVCIPNTFTADSVHQQKQADSKAHGSGHTSGYNIFRGFERVRAAGKQNEMLAKSCFVIHERTSRYDPLSSCLVDFKGRANMASVKNAQFVPSTPQATGGSPAQQLQTDHEREYLMQMGKTTEDCFNMDYRYPMSLLQSFAVCIARFDAKLTW